MAGNGESGPLGVRPPMIDDALKEGKPSCWLSVRSMSGGNDVFEAPNVAFALENGSKSCEPSPVEAIDEAAFSSCVVLMVCGSIWSQPCICGSVMEPGYGGAEVSIIVGSP